jgi:Ca-activated chloride channel family protein
MQSLELAKDGVLVVLTDGQVGNEDQILATFMDRRSSSTARVYSFGIGTNVSDGLLRSLADRTGGGVEMIHPGERIDEKVVATFAKATAPRVTDLKISFRGVEGGEIAPAEPKALVDGEPFALFGTFETSGIGAVEIRGKRDGESFYLEVPIDLPDACDRPVVAKLWAQARIRDLERSIVTGRRADTMKQRIIDLAKAHGVSSKYTSFIVVEKRSGDRRQNAMPETRVVPVNAPAGWAMHQHQTSVAAPRAYSMNRMMAPSAPAPAMARRSMPRPAAGMPAGYSPPPPPMAAGGAPPTPPPGRSSPITGAAPPLAQGRPSIDALYDMASSGEEADDADESVRTLARDTDVDYARASSKKMFEMDAVAGSMAAPLPEPSDPILALLSKQAASGLWETAGKDPIETTAVTLVALLKLGVTAAHAVHGAQVKKAVEALLERFAATPPKDARIAQLALGVAWLMATGRRTKKQIEDTAQACGAKLDDETRVRAEVERLA